MRNSCHYALEPLPNALSPPFQKLSRAWFMLPKVFVFAYYQRALLVPSNPEILLPVLVCLLRVSPKMLPRRPIVAMTWRC